MRQPHYREDAAQENWLAVKIADEETTDIVRPQKQIATEESMIP